MLTLYLAAALAGPVAAFSINGLGTTPQMGWDNWNAYGCSVNQNLLLNTASRMKTVGLADAGYEYVILDDCWSDGRYPNKSLKPDFTKFPNGMAYIADYIHNLDMKYGMYSSAGLYTCAGYAGSLGYETIDANTWASWGVDYLKYDNCYNQGQSGTPYLSFTRYQNMSIALNQTGRPIFYSMCNWGEDGPWSWAPTIANSWRTSGDIWNSFNSSDPRCPCENKEGLDCKLPGFHCSMMNVIDKAAYYLNKGAPGGWNDLDMLEIGNGEGLTDEEGKAMFTMWAAVKSPLIIGADVPTMDADAFSIYMNPAIIAINQDPLGSPVARRYRRFANGTEDVDRGDLEMFSGQLYGSNMVVVLLNAGDTDMTMNATLAEIFYDDGGDDSKEAMMSYDLFDLWGNRMSNDTAEAILSSNSSSTASNYSQDWLNITETSYAEALAYNNSVVLGKQVGTVQPMGTISAMVPSHGVMAYRLRPQPSSSGKDEL